MRFGEAAMTVMGCALLIGGCATLPMTGQGTASVDLAPVPADAQSRFERALALMQAGDDRAERELISLAEDYPQLAGPHVNLGLVYARSDRLDLAEAALTEALERNPDNAAACNELAIVYRRSGRFAEAEQAYARAVAVDPGYALAWRNRGVLNDLYLQRPEAALEAYERYQALQPQADEGVAKWIADLRLRIESSQRTAQAGAP
ncbi:MAG: tetratricopeptide repeat protein [Gammaproteobacteria bacterium]